MNKFLPIFTLALLSIGFYNQYAISTVDYYTQFENYATKFNRRYTDAERIFRQEVFIQNLKLIEEHNADTTKTYRMGETQFSDLTSDEFQGIFLGYTQKSSRLPEYIPQNDAALTVDWTGVTDVKDQGTCRAGWAFSAIGVIESVIRIQGTGTLNLSEQQLVDCDTQSYGCNSGWPDLAVFWSSRNGNKLNSEYPYTGRNQACYNKTGKQLIKGALAVAADVSSLQKALTTQPVAVVVDSANWQHYTGGVFSACAKNLSHPVLAIGYYEDGTWLIKNSWGTKWGEAGLMRLAAGDTCGILQDATIAVL